MVWNAAMPAVVGCTLRFINKNYAEPMRVEEIARQQRCHPDYLSRVFKRSVGTGINEYLHQIRIGHARELLQVEKLSIGEIGFMIGDHDQSHFGKVFRKLTGMSPAESRSKALKKNKRSTSPPAHIDYFEYSNLHEFTPDQFKTRTTRRRRKS